MRDAPRLVPFANQEAIDAGVARAVAQLKSERLLAYPTETVYGLGSSLHAEALDRLQAIKPRSVGKPFLVLVADTDGLDLLGAKLTSAASQLAARFWPGPLTLILPGGRPAHVAIRGADGEIAVRWTSHEGAARIIRAWGAPITSTSANAPGLPPATTSKEIAIQWEREVASGELLVLDGGPLVASPPSTIVDCCGDHPRLVRAGIISAEELRETVPDLAGVK